jgi:hypothetical protein
MSNMAIWDQVCTTDPNQTKTVNQRGGYTAIVPQYQIQQATEVFGPYGKGWGFASCDLDMSQIEPLGLVIVKAIFFYVTGGDRSEFPINNAWPVKQGSRIDPDFAKKAETNTMSKALSKLGFGADVFMGQFDDNEYLQEAAKTASVKSAESALDKKEREEQEYNDWMQEMYESFANASTMQELQAAHKSRIRKAKARGYDTAILHIERAKDKHKERLESQEVSTNDSTV